VASALTLHMPRCVIELTCLQLRIWALATALYNRKPASSILLTKHGRPDCAHPMILAM
jgi:hypothetical protein